MITEQLLGLFSDIQANRHPTKLKVEVSKQNHTNRSALKLPKNASLKFYVERVNNLSTKENKQTYKKTKTEDITPWSYMLSQPSAIGHHWVQKDRFRLVF